MTPSETVTPFIEAMKPVYEKYVLKMLGITALK